jgi:hypothetical protein
MSSYRSVAATSHIMDLGKWGSGGVVGYSARGDVQEKGKAQNHEDLSADHIYSLDCFPPGPDLPHLRDSENSLPHAQAPTPSKSLRRVE